MHIRPAKIEDIPELVRLVNCVYLKKEGEKLYLGMLSVWPAKQGAGIGS
jgi:hypothetical protein